MRNFGFAGYDEVNSVGTNGKMAEVSAAMGLSSFARLEEFVATNKLNYESYRSSLAGVPAVEVIDYNEAERNNFQYIVLQIAADHDGLTRDELLAALWAENVIARRYFYPGCHRMEPYLSERSYQLPATEELAQRLLLLPNGTAVNDSDIKRICQVVHLIMSHPREVKERLSSANAARKSA